MFRIFLIAFFIIFSSVGVLAQTPAEKDLEKIESYVNECNTLSDAEIEKKSNLIIKIANKYPQNTNFIIEKGWALKQIADIKKDKADYPKTIELTNQVIVCAIKSESKILHASALQIMADALVQQKQKSAIDTLEKCIQIFISSKNKVEDKEGFQNNLASYYTSLADACSEFADTTKENILRKKAVYNYHLAFKTTFSDKQKTDILINLGYHLFKMKDYKSALLYYNQSLKITPKDYNKEKQGRRLNNIGFIFFEQGKINEALKYYQNALELMLKSTIPNPTIEQLLSVTNRAYITTLLSDKALALTASFRETANPKSLELALKTYLLLDQIIDKMRIEQSEGAKLFWRGEAHDMYEEALSVCLTLKDYEHAYLFMEKSRAVVLWESLRESQKIDKNTSFIPLETLKHSLSLSKQAFVYYFVGNKGVYILSIIDKKINFIQKFEGNINTYTKLVNEYLSLCRLNTEEEQMIFRKDEKYLEHYQKRIINRFPEISHFLYKELLGDLKIPKGKLIISTDDKVIPFETLMKNSSARWHQNYLINDNLISYAYSADLYFRKYKLFETQKQFLGIAPAEDLKNAVVSLKNIMTNGFYGDILEKEKTDKETLLKIAPNYSILNFYSHAISNPEPKIRFSKQQSLELNEIYDMQLNAQMVVLGACETGVGFTQKGEGVMSLARGFAVAGTPTTITTLWAVEDNYIYTLLENFYVFLAKGLKKDEALYQAKLSLLNTNITNALPFRLGSTVIIGNDSNIQPQKMSDRTHKLILLMVSVVLLFFIFRKILLLYSTRTKNTN